MDFESTTKQNFGELRGMISILRQLRRTLPESRGMVFIASARSVRHILRHTLQGPTRRAYEGASAKLKVRVMGRRLYLVQCKFRPPSGGKTVSLLPLPWSPRNLPSFLLLTLIFASGLASRADIELNLRPTRQFRGHVAKATLRMCLPYGCRTVGL